MHIILLSGGSGKRLWPLSNGVRSKQFIKIFQNDTGSYESMLQRIYRQIISADSEAAVTIATSKVQASAIYNQLGKDNIDICIEPCRRDTFPAIALASVYLHDVRNVSLEEPVVVCPVDPYVDNDYFAILKELGSLAFTGEANLTLLGIEPSYPSEKYGYIIPADKKQVSRVISFKEKPDKKTAESYIKQGGLWNGGVFAYKLQYAIKKAHEFIDFTDFDDLFQKYEMLEKISFDYAVVEKETRIQVIRYHGQWKDLGTWNTLTEAIEESCIGKSIVNDNCENVHVINELDIPVLCMGLKDVVVSASPDGILVSDKEESSYMKPYVENINQQVRYMEKSWGSYHVLDVNSGSLTIKITLKPGMQMKYHSHEHRDEVWIIISGKGRTVVDGQEKQVNTGDVVTMQAGCRHTIVAESELKVIEIQIGKDINIHDKQKFVTVQIS